MLYMEFQCSKLKLHAYMLQKKSPLHESSLYISPIQNAAVVMTHLLQMTYHWTVTNFSTRGLLSGPVASWCYHCGCRWFCMFCVKILDLYLPSHALIKLADFYLVVLLKYRPTFLEENIREILSRSNDITCKYTHTGRRNCHYCCTANWLSNQHQKFLVYDI